MKKLLSRLILFAVAFLACHSSHAATHPGLGISSQQRYRAVRDGDDYIVNGAKIWTSYAQFADWIFCLVRTSSEGKKQEGISFLLIDMKSPGITVQPIILLDGTHEVNEIHFDDVETARGWTVGAPGGVRS